MNKKNFNYLPLVILFLLTIILGVVFYFTHQKYSSLVRLERETNQLNQDLIRLEDANTSYSSYSSLTQDWSRTLPANETEVAAFAAQVEQQARSHSLVVELNFEDFIKQIDIQSPFNGLGLDISLTGSYQNLLNFLSSLESLPYFYRINKITITQNELTTGVKATLSGALITK